MRKAWIWTRGVLLWLLYMQLTVSKRLEHEYARQEGRRVKDLRHGVLWTTYTVDRSRGPQGRSWLTWREFRALHIDPHL